ncbi:MAG: response regulator [Acidimicrobiales bacterium]
MKPLKVFVVDDDPDFAEGVALTLEIEGHEVTFASSGEEAIDRIREDDFDVTLMDVRMPGINGLESMQQIRRIKPSARVIMMTAYSAEDLLARAVDEGALGVLHKPISQTTLLQALLRVESDRVILVADDDPDFAAGLKATLHGAGYSVDVATDGQEALDKVLRGSFDVLLLDLRLPVLSGVQLYTELARQGRTLPTLIVTGYAVEEEETITRLLDMSVDGYFVKPVRSVDLLRAIDVLVA